VLECSLLDDLSQFLTTAARRVRGLRENESLSDLNFALAGICRVLSKSNSGREWLQCDSPLDICRSTFFDALQSGRREPLIAALSRQLTEDLAERLQSEGVDFLADIPRLAEVEVIAVDGHEIEHPQHASKNAKGMFTSVKTIYQINLHNGLSLPLARVGEDGLKAHEWPAFKRLLAERIKTRKVHTPLLYVLDRAYVDIAFWDGLCKKNVFMITRYKENMNPMMKHPIPYDRKDLRNRGVTGCFLLGFAGLGSAYLIEYTDPETGTEYKFITTAMQLQPGEIAWLYFCRWRIEKTFDTFEHNLEEDKAWATGSTAQLQQSYFISMGYNFLRFIEQILDRKHDMKDEKVIRKYQQQLNRRQKKAAENGMTLSPFISASRRMAKLSLQYIRCFRKHFFGQSPPEVYLPDFQKALFAYL